MPNLLPKRNPLFHRGKANTLSPDDLALKERCRSDFGLFVREFFPDDLKGEPSEMHRDLFTLFSGDYKPGLMLSLAAPRGNAKTTVAVMIRALHAIVYRHQAQLLIIGFSEAEAKVKLRDIKRHIEQNERFRAVYGDLKGKVWGEKEIITANDVNVVARGKGGQVRGLKHGKDRPGIIFLDDIESLESTNTPEQVQKTKDWVEKDVMGCVQSDGSSQVILCGTVIRATAYLVHTLTTAGFDQRKKYSAIKSWATRQDLWQEWEALYRDLDDPDGPATARAFYEANKADMDEGTEVLWRAGETYYDLMVYKVKKGSASLYSEKQNEPLDPSTQIFNPDACRKFTIQWGEEGILGEPKFWIVSGEKRIKSDDCKRIAFHDPVMAKSDTSDYAAITVVAQDSSGYCYILDSWVKREHPSKQVDAALGLCQKWDVQTIYFEEQGFQALMKPMYTDRMALYNQQALRMVPITQHKNKEWRIGSMEPWFSNGWVLFNTTVPTILVDQLKQFPNGHDDGPDSLQGCIERLTQPRGTVQQTQEGTFLR